MSDQVHGAAIILLSALLAACSPREFAGLAESKEWVEAGLETAQDRTTAILDWSGLPGAIAVIDGLTVRAGFDRATLSSGRHVIEYEYHPAEFGVHPKGTIEIHLVAGHSYEFRSKLCYWCRPRKHTEWVVDGSTNVLVWGAYPTWPCWYL